MKIVIVTLLALAVVMAMKIPGPTAETTELRDRLISYLNNGDHRNIVTELEAIEADRGNLLLDNQVPSFYSIKAVAAHGLRDQERMRVALEQAVKHYPHETRAWINLGEHYMTDMKFSKAFENFQKAHELQDEFVLTRLLNAKGWSSNWKDIELISTKTRNSANRCFATLENCTVDSVVGLEFSDVGHDVLRYLTSFAPFAKDSKLKIPPKHLAKRFKKGDLGRRRLRIGLLSSDLNVHPVSSLIRGVIELIDKSRVDLYCFVLNIDFSWWAHNISTVAEHFVVIHNMNTYDAASVIASKKIDILIDLNGLTKNSGLTIMSHRPAPIQMSFLGLPTTTGANFIDYFLGDYVSLPPEHRGHFKESLVLMSMCYISNDYAQTQGDVVTQYDQDHRSARSLLAADRDLLTATILFGTIANSQKLDMTAFHLWMNILNRFPGSKLVFHDHSGMQEAMVNLRTYSRYFGVSTDRLSVTSKAAWIDHLKLKTTFDLFLDTVIKNGHTTGLDAVWSGVPSVSVGGGGSMSTRAAESIVDTLGSPHGLAYSLKEYEDMVARIGTKTLASKKAQDVRTPCMEAIMSSDEDLEMELLDKCLHEVEDFVKRLDGSKMLRLWRKDIEQRRTMSNLFDTKLWSDSFVTLMEAVVEITQLRPPNNNKKKRPFHIFSRVPSDDPSQRERSEPLPVHQVHPDRDASQYMVNVENYQDYVTVHDELTPKYDHTHYLPEHTGSGAWDAQDEFDWDEMELISLVADSDDDPWLSPGNGLGPVTSRPFTKLENQSELKLPMISRSHYNAIPEWLWTLDRVLLNVGGVGATPGWINVNAQVVSFGNRVKGDVAVVRNMYDLQGFHDNSVMAIYNSHTLEHSAYGDGSLSATLQEWHRVLVEEGAVLIAVPDISKLLRIYLSGTLDVNEMFLVTRMLFGAQTDAFDYHLVGFDFDILEDVLRQHGFCNITPVQGFLVANDSSRVVVNGISISLCVTAVKCRSDGKPATMDALVADYIIY